MTSSEVLQGRRVLIPRRKPDDALATAVGQAGAVPVAAALTRSVPGDAAALSQATAALLAGEFDWLVLTSARTVSALAPFLEAHLRVGGELPAQVATVGPATARAWWQLTGQDPQLTGAGSGAALLAAPEFSAGPMCGLVPERSGRVLLPVSAIAPETLPAGLRAAGWQVTRVDAYSTVTADAAALPPGLTAAWRGEAPDPLVAVVLTAGSTARAALELLGPPPARLRVVALGQPTAEAAGALGLRVDAVAPSPTPTGLIAALTDCFKESS